MYMYMMLIAIYVCIYFVSVARLNNINYQGPVVGQ